MFKLTRFFLLTGTVAVAAIIVAVVLYRQGEVEQLIEFTEGQNVALAQSFANTIWPRFASYVHAASKLGKEAIRTRPETQQITAAVAAVSSGLPTLKVKIYDLDGYTVYSSQLAEIGEDEGDHPSSLDAARKGLVASELIFRDRFDSFGSIVEDRDLVESYLPIRHGDGPVEGIFELYSDVTPLMDQLKRSMAKLVAGLLLVFGGLFGFLFPLVRRADRTIRRQYVDITGTNEALRREVIEREQAQEALGKAHDELEGRVEERTRELVEEMAERKRAEDEARQHRDVLAYFGRVSIMGEMATSLAHELNQPLTVISSYAQVCLAKLRSGRDDPDELAGSLEHLVNSAELLAEQADLASEIVRRVRGFVHKVDRERGEIEVNATILDIADMIRSDAREHDTTVELDLADELPLVEADAIQIQQVVLNLAHNGMEAMSDCPAEERRLTLHTRLGHGGAVEVVARDRGPGIPTEALEQVFAPFITTKSEGLGMGLAISRSIVEAHGGKLWAVSDRETGAAFHFTLPVVEGNRSHDG